MRDDDPIWKATLDRALTREETATVIRLLKNLTHGAGCSFAGSRDGRGSLGDEACALDSGRDFPCSFCETRAFLKKLLDVPPPGLVENPTTMAKVQALVSETYPRRPFTVWIDQKGRHVAVRFLDGDRRRYIIEGVGTTWRGALEHIEDQRKARRTKRARVLAAR
jgi:hypothetical protein